MHSARMHGWSKGRVEDKERKREKVMRGEEEAKDEAAGGRHNGSINATARASLFKRAF